MIKLMRVLMDYMLERVSIRPILQESTADLINI